MTATCEVSAASGRLLALFLVLGAGLSGCSRSSEQPVPASDTLGREPAAFVSFEGEPVGYALTTLPTSGVVAAGKSGAICYSHKGEEQWRFEVDEGDEIAAAPAVAPDSTVFVLTRRALVAIGAKGDRLWTLEVEPAGIPAVVALGDGSAVVTAGAGAMVNVSGGKVQWRFQLPDGDVIASIPRASSNSQIFVQGTARLYAVDASGIPLWDHAL